jgi:hypothetical protein
MLQQIGDRPLRVSNFDVVGIVVGQQRHGPIVALGSDLVLNLPPVVNLLLQGLQFRDPLTHAFNGDQAEGTHGQEQDGANQEGGQEPGGIVELPPDQVDERLGYAWVEPPAAGRRARARQRVGRFLHNISHPTSAPTITP